MTETSRSYADALFSLAAELNSIPQTLDALRFARNELYHTEGALDLLASPAIPKDERLAVLHKAFGEQLSGETIEPFDIEKYQAAYVDAAPDDRAQTFLGRFFLAAMAQKSMVTNKIFRSGNLLAGWSVDFREKGFRGIKDFRKLVEAARKEGKS